MPEDLGNSGLPRAGIKVSYSLTDFHRPASGLTLMARGTHVREVPLVIPKDTVDPQGIEVCDLKMDAGDALLFENRIFHTAAPNRSDRTSKVVIYGYAYRWMKPEIYLDPPDPERLAGADLIARQLLGGYPDIDTSAVGLAGVGQRHGVLPKRESRSRSSHALCNPSLSHSRLGEKIEGKGLPAEPDICVFIGCSPKPGSQP